MIRLTSLTTSLKCFNNSYFDYKINLHLKADENEKPPQSFNQVSRLEEFRTLSKSQATFFTTKSQFKQFQYILYRVLRPNHLTFDISKRSYKADSFDSIDLVTRVSDFSTAAVKISLCGFNDGVHLLIRHNTKLANFKDFEYLLLYLQTCSTS